MQIETVGPSRTKVYQNILSGNQACHRGDLLVPGSPQYIGLESTTKCNIDCIQCGLKSHPLRNLDLPESVLQMLSSGGYLEKATSLIFSDYGEPLMSSRLTALLDLVSQYDIPVSSFFTNGTLMTDELAEKIVSSGVRLILISMDAATAATYQKIRRGSDFELVVRNIERLQKIKGRMGTPYPRLHFNCVGMKSNVDELPELVKLASQLGIEAVIYSNLIPYSYELSQESLARIPELAESKKEQARVVAREMGIRLGLAGSHLPIAQNRPKPIEQEVDLGEEFFSGRLAVSEMPAQLERGEIVTLDVRMENLSTQAWLSSHSARAYPVNLGHRWLDAEGKTLGDEGRAMLQHDIGPGETAELEVVIRAPEQPGVFKLELDLVREGVQWFGLGQSFTVQIGEGFRVGNYPMADDRCEFPWKSAHIKVNGDVYPCCFLSKSMGNLLESGFEGVWNGPSYKRLRQSVAQGTYEVCKGAHCKFVTNDPEPAFLAEISCSSPPVSFLSQEERKVEVRVTNLSRVPWMAHGDEVDSVVRLSYHWFKTNGDPRVFDGIRTPLPHNIGPGESVALKMNVQAPKRTGEYTLCLDLVMEHVSWFANAGNPPLNLPVSVLTPPKSLGHKVQRWLARRASSSFGNSKVG